MKSKKSIPFTLFTVFLLLLFSSIFSCSSSEKKQDPRIYLSYNDAVAGIRSRENASALFIEQKLILENGKSFIVPTYASQELLIKNPKNKGEELENIIISIANDTSSIYIYNSITVSKFLSSEITGKELKYLLSAEGMDFKAELKHQEMNMLYKQALGTMKLLKKKHRENAVLASELLNVFVSNGYWQDPETLDADYFSNIKQKPLLAQTGIPYRQIQKSELESLLKSDYPLYPFLLKTGIDRVVNKLPNCAQGATQLSFGYAVYTKVSQFLKDVKKLYLPVTDLNDVQAGDIFYQVWDMEAGATTNSGHMGTILDITYTNSGNIHDMLLLEFFPSNSVPIVIPLSRSIYSISSLQNINEIPDGPWGIKRLRNKSDIKTSYNKDAVEMFLDVFLFQGTSRLFLLYKFDNKKINN